MLGIDVIRKVGPTGEFLTEEHTLKHFRQERWQPIFLNRNDPESWIKMGKTRYGDKVIKKALEVLESHQPELLPEAVQQKLNEIYNKAEKQLADIKFKA